MLPALAARNDAMLACYLLRGCISALIIMMTLREATIDSFEDYC
jgi:hypothetical protein